MDKDKYVAYVSSYTWGNKSNFGIRIYDVDMENGRMTENFTKRKRLKLRILLM